MKKECSKCREKKKLSEFYRDSTHKSGRSRYCKKCSKKYKKQWFQENKDSCYEYYKNHYDPKYHKEYRKNNKEYFRKKRRDHYAANKENELMCHSEWCKSNKDKCVLYASKRRAVIRHQTAPGLNESKIKEIFSTCAFMNSISKNIKWEVDHIIPLSKGGLHHECNLQILTMEANRRKYNKILL